ncbi:hypothetical protein [Novosphingobium resinovorum]|uniref:hypothetical protein n=1 Tax=Novosphingobium resinovorum TaxID=158500 RepID=UPI001F2CDA77|nr:hypothetical protein [Novosphingobium resinovorum]
MGIVEALKKTAHRTESQRARSEPHRDAAELALNAGMIGNGKIGWPHAISSLPHRSRRRGIDRAPRWHHPAARMGPSRNRQVASPMAGGPPPPCR